MKEIGSKITVGADPELFLKLNGKVIGSERVVPKEGLPVTYGAVVRDGVQIELHPQQTEQYSPTTPIYGIYYAIQALDALLKKSHPNVTICFDGVVDVMKKELLALSVESRMLGCQPSENVYGLKEIKVDPMRYRTRSAGGHVHLGLPELLMEYRTRFPSVLDAVLGIPCVLLDRDVKQAERRKLYGRAGEYRTPPHGVEYRTLSNFWLHSPILAEFVLSQAKMAADIVFSTVTGDGNPEKELLTKVNFRTMIRAIQTNSAALAWDVWKDAVRPFIMKHCNSAGKYPLHSANIPNFERLVNSVAKDGLKGIDGPDPVMNWNKLQHGYYGGLWRAHVGKY